MSADGDPNPAGTPPAFAGTVATGVGGRSWTPDEWARWRSRAWYSAQPASALAGAQSARAEGSW
eukprot:12610419-Alexandrium_andersonii.AAC.1